MITDQQTFDSLPVQWQDEVMRLVRCNSQPGWALSTVLNHVEARRQAAAEASAHGVSYTDPVNPWTFPSISFRRNSSTVTVYWSDAFGRLKTSEEVKPDGEGADGCSGYGYNAED